MAKFGSRGILIAIPRCMDYRGYRIEFNSCVEAFMIEGFPSQYWAIEEAKASIDNMIGEPEPMDMVTERSLDNANCDAWNGLLQDIVKYCVKYSCSLSDSINDYDYPLSNEVALVIEEAALYILHSLEDQALNERL